MPQTIEATAFAASLGVNVHLNFAGTAYTNLTQVQAALDYLGINNMRDKGGQANMSAYDTMASKGYHFDFFAPSDPQLDPATFAQRIDAFASAHPGAIVSIEGPNEINGWPITYNGGSGLPNGAQYQQAVYNAINADPKIANIPVINLSLAADSPGTYAPLGNMSGASDWGNVHSYMSFGNQPSVQFSTLESYAQAVTPGHPMAVTETGYSTLASDTNLGVDEATQAKLILNLVLDSAKAGMAATYLYELVDNQYSGAGAWNNVGLYHSDWTPKPVVGALHNLMSAFSGGAGESVMTSAPDYTVSGLTNGSSLTMHEANGTYDIVVWAEPDIWDQNAHKAITAATQTATINLTQSVGSYSVYDPLTGQTVASGGATNAIKVNVTDHPLIVEVHGSGGATLPGSPIGDAPGTVLSTPAGGGTATGGDGNDTINGADGPNILAGGGGQDVINGGALFDSVQGNMGNDTEHGGKGDDWVVGGKDQDLLYGDDGNDIVYGNLGNDTCDGANGNDLIRGGQGDDALTGDGGNDWLSGDRGNDTLTGGAGADVFHTFSQAGIDTVMDFHQSEGDRVQVDPGTTYSLSQVGADTVIDMGGGNEMILKGVQLASLQSGWIFAA